jgi:hypothetical protein
MKLVNAKGESVTFVVQDRSSGFEIKDDMYEDLGGLLGEGALEQVVVDQTTFGFDPIVMLAPTPNGRTVQEVVGDRLGGMLEDMVERGELSRGQADSLLAVKTFRTFRPGFLQLLPAIVGKSVKKFSEVVDAVGSAIVQYVKAG